MPYTLDQPRIEFKNRPILFIDLEMTGLDSQKHEIIEIGALLVSQPDFRQENSFYTKIKPVHPDTGDPRSLKITGYSDKNWLDAISLHQALQELADFAPNCFLAGWSVQNDWDFLNHALLRENIPIFYDHRLIEVFSLAYAKFYRDSQMKFINLPVVARRLGIHIDQHKPDSDVRATYEIFKKLITSSSGYPE